MRSGRAIRSTRKPDWVVHWLVWMKAWDRHASCRALAECFNRQHAERAMTISKSYAARVIARHAHDIRALRRAWKQRVPSIGAPNQTWAMDLSYASVPYDFTTMELGHAAPEFGQVENAGVDSGFLRQHLLLGIVDHGTRACIALAELADKSSGSIWRELVECFKHYGVPKRLRVDNEACFHGLALASATRGASPPIGERTHPRILDAAGVWARWPHEKRSLFLTAFVDC